MSAIIPIFIPHVGCPHDCIFCNQKKIAGTIKAPTADEIREKIISALAYSGELPQIAFYGGSFTAIPEDEMKAFLSVAKEFIDEKKVSSIRLSTRPDCIDEKNLGILREYSVETIELGTQSMIDSVLLKSGRGHSASDTVLAAKLIKQYGFKLILQMMTHLPGSDDEKDIRTAQLISELCPDGVRVYPTVVIRDTALEKMWQKGEYKACTPEEAAKLGGEIIKIFEEKNIPIIRFGLNPTDDLSSGEALAGAYHPALGEMAMSERYLLICSAEIEKRAIKKGSALKIRVNPRRVSVMSGQKKSNKRKLIEKYGFSGINVVSDASVPDGEVFVETE